MCSGATVSTDNFVVNQSLVFSSSTLTVNGSLTVDSATLTLQDSQVTSSGLSLQNSSVLSILVSAPTEDSGNVITVNGPVTLSGTLVVNITDFLDGGNSTIVLLSSSQNISGGFANIVIGFEKKPSSDPCKVTTYSATPQNSGTSYELLLSSSTVNTCDPKTDPMPTWEIAVIAVCGILVVAGILSAVIIIGKKRKRDSAEIMLRSRS